MYLKDQTHYLGLISHVMKLGTLLTCEKDSEMFRFFELEIYCQILFSHEKLIGTILLLNQTALIHTRRNI